MLGNRRQLNGDETSKWNDSGTPSPSSERRMHIWDNNWFEGIINTVVVEMQDGWLLEWGGKMMNDIAKNENREIA